MKNDSINYVLVGSFVLVMVLALLLSIALLTGRTGTTDTYFTRYQDATGLKYGSQVLYMGFPVGQVEDIKPVVEGGQVVFDVELSLSEDVRGWNVPADSVAEVRAAGLLAAVAIDIRAGTSEQVLKPGSRIRGRGQTDVFDAVNDTANALRELTHTSIRPLLQNLNAHVSRFGKVLDDKAGPLVENLSMLSAELARRAPDVIEDFLRTTSQLRGLSERLQAVLNDDNARKVGSVVDNVVLASENFAGLAEDARGQLDALLGPAGLGRVDRLLDDAAATLAETLALSRGARAGMERILSEDNLTRMDRTVGNLEAAAQGARDLLGEDNRTRVARSLSDLEQASAQARALLDEETLEAVDRAMRNVDAASGGLESLVTDTRLQLGRVLSEANLARFDRSLVNVEEAAGGLRRLLDAESLSSVGRSLSNLEAASQGMKALVGEENRASVMRSLANAEQASEQLSELLGSSTRERLDRALQNVSVAATNIAQLSGSLQQRVGEVVTPELSDRLARTLDNFSSAAGSIARLGSELLGTRERLDSLLATLGEAAVENRPGVRDSVRALRHSLRTVAQSIDAVANNVEGASRNMLELSRRLKSNPGLLLRAPAADDDPLTTTSGG